MIIIIKEKSKLKKEQTTTAYLVECPMALIICDPSRQNLLVVGSYMFLSFSVFSVLVHTKTI